MMAERGVREKTKKQPKMWSESWWPSHRLFVRRRAGKWGVTQTHPLVQKQRGNTRTRAVSYVGIRGNVTTPGILSIVLPHAYNSTCAWIFPRNSSTTWSRCWH